MVEREGALGRGYSGWREERGSIKPYGGGERRVAVDDWWIFTIFY